jgi:hypothetical protein
MSFGLVAGCVSWKRFGPWDGLLHATRGAYSRDGVVIASSALATGCAVEEKYEKTSRYDDAVDPQFWSGLALDRHVGRGCMKERVVMVFSYRVFAPYHDIKQNPCYPKPSSIHS